MPTETEAACLLRSGLAFPRRVGLRSRRTEPSSSPASNLADFRFIWGTNPTSTSTSKADGSAPWWAAPITSKDLNGSVESIDRRRAEAGLTLHRRRLSLAESLDLDASIRSVALRLLEALQDGTIRLESPPESAREVSRSDLLAMLDRIAQWDDSAWFRQRERHQATYAASGFLPPSCPSPIVLQASILEEAPQGFSPVPAVLRTPQEFADHACSVANLLGRRAVQARGLVIQHGDFWNQPAQAIQRYLEKASEVFPLSGKGNRPRLSDRPMDQPLLDGFYAFLTDLSDLGPNPDGWRHAG